MCLTGPAPTPHPGAIEGPPAQWRLLPPELGDDAPAQSAIGAIANVAVRKLWGPATS
jgi:hypothetical protein